MKPSTLAVGAPSRRLIPPRVSRGLCGALALLPLLAAGRAAAQSPSRPLPGGGDAAGDRYFLMARSETYMPLFQRALLPGPAGSRVETATVATAYQYATLRLGDLDSPLGQDSIDADLSLWAGVEIVDSKYQGPVEGDVSIANVSHRLGPASARLGRQIQTTGAARYAHFDGLTLNLKTEAGLGATAYGGFTVLPRWDARPGYHHLGSAIDSLVDDPDALDEPSRGGNWLAGGRLFGSLQDVGEVGLSIHEQRDGGELGRRDAGLDFLLQPLEQLTLSGRALLGLGTPGLADALFTVDVYPSDLVDVAVEYRRVDPTLLLSRQSVLSVFAVDAYDELGATARLRPTDRWTVRGYGYADRLESGRGGYRAGGETRIAPDQDERVLLILGYGRAREEANGYHSLRGAARYRPVDPLSFVVEHYTYVYDEAISGLSSSNVEAANAEYQILEPLSVLLGGSLHRSPYARLDAQGLLRLVYAADLGPRDHLSEVAR